MVNKAGQVLRGGSSFSPRQAKHSKQRQGYDSVANADHRYGRHFPDDEFGEHRLNTPDDASTDQKCRGGKLVRLHGSADRPFDDDL